MSEPPSRPVQLFATCLVENIRPQVGLAAVHVLERLGCRVSCPAGQTCCGQPAHNAGCLDDARAMARHTIDTLSRSQDPVVVPSGSCTDMLVHHYAELFRDEPALHQAAAALAARTHELSQFLVGTLGVRRVLARRPGRIAYHASCHLLRGLRVADAPLQLLAGIAEAELVPLQGAEECCGFGGLFAVEMSDVSGAMLRRKLERIRESGAEVVVACDTGCLLHIEGGLRRQAGNVGVLHLAEVLAGAE